MLHRNKWWTSNCVTSHPGHTVEMKWNFLVKHLNLVSSFWVWFGQLGAGILMWFGSHHPLSKASDEKQSFLFKVIAFFNFEKASDKDKLMSVSGMLLLSTASLASWSAHSFPWISHFVIFQDTTCILTSTMKTATRKPLSSPPPSPPPLSPASRSPSSFSKALTLF